MKLLNFVVNMRRFILFVSMLCMSAGLHAQQTIAYTYDAAGNRTGRAVYTSRDEQEDELQSDEYGQDGLERSLYHVTVAPNPTRGYLQVYVQELEDGDVCMLSLFDVTGRCVQTQSTRQMLTTLDLTTLGDGLYLLRVNIGEEDIAVVKIIKESN